MTIHAPLAIQPAAPGGGLRWAVLDGITVAKRNLIGMLRTPEVVVFGLVQPIMFVVLFTYVFGGAIRVEDYRQYLMAGVFTQTVAFATAITCMGVAEDMKRGLMDRFRSLPMARSAVLSGRTVSDSVLSAVSLVVMALTGLLVGWRAPNGLLGAAAGFGLLLLFGFAMSWVGAFIGLAAKSAQAAQTAGTIWLFPLTFLSNAFVPVDGMPAALRTVAEWNPVSVVVSSVRDMFGNKRVLVPDSFPSEHPLLVSAGWIVLILVVFVPLAVRKYRAAMA